MLRLLLVLTATLFLSAFTKAYAHAPKAYFEFERSKGATLVIEGKSYEPSFWSGFSSAGEAFTKDQAAHQHFKNYSDDLQTGNTILLGGVAADLAFLFYASNNSEKFSRGTVSSIYWGSFLGILFASGIYHGSAIENFYKAINTFNGVDETGSDKKTKKETFTLAPGFSMVDGKNVKPTLDFTFKF